MDNYIIINYGLPLLGIIITALAQFFVNSSYNNYKKINIKKGISGAEVARRILDKHNLQHIKVNSVRGNLTDHYDPSKKVVNLSTDIYSGCSIASIAVASHECGHAIQDKYKYLFMKIRSLIVPLVNFSTKIGYFVVILGLIFGWLKLAWIGIILLLSMLLFQIITLPVEFNASKRALNEIKEMNILEETELNGAKTMLTAAAFTYVAGMLSTLFQVLRLALMVRGNDD